MMLLNWIISSNITNKYFQQNRLEQMIQSSDFIHSVHAILKLMRLFFYLKIGGFFSMFLHKTYQGFGCIDTLLMGVRSY